MIRTIQCHPTRPRFGERRAIENPSSDAVRCLGSLVELPACARKGHPTPRTLRPAGGTPHGCSVSQELPHSAAFRAGCGNAASATDLLPAAIPGTTADLRLPALGRAD